jgi:comEA protein
VEWLEKYQVPIGIGLILFIALGGIVLLFEEQRNKLVLTKQEPTAEILNYEQEREELVSKITELETKLQAIETQKTETPISSANTNPAIVSGTQTSGLINLNTATIAELDKLPGIGESKANEIIRFRQEKGGFAKIEQLKEVKGIGESTFNKLKPLVTVR